MSHIILTRIVLTQCVVQSAGPHVKPRIVDVTELVCIKPIRSEEHREEENDVWVRTESLPKTEDLGLPSWVLHHDYPTAIAAYDMFGINECPGEACAEERENHETDICTIRNCCFSSVAGVKVER